MAQPVIEAKDVTVRYKVGDFKEIGIKEYFIRNVQKNFETKDFFAVQDVNFTINEGDMLGIIGNNGAGKSTLLKVVTQIMVPSHGRS